MGKLRERLQSHKPLAWGLLERRRAWILLLAAVLSTALGLLCRYLLEYGEASNEVNFVPFQIGIYLITVPLYMLSVFMAAYFAEQYFV